MGDLNRPLKNLFRAIRPIEDKILTAIYSRFGIKDYDLAEIRRADDIMLATEAHCLMKNTTDWGLKENYLPNFIISGWSPEKAEEEFLKTFYDLGEPNAI